MFRISCPRRSQRKSEASRVENVRPKQQRCEGVRTFLEQLEERTLMACNALAADIADGIDFGPLESALAGATNLGAKLPFVGQKFSELKPEEIIQKLEDTIKNKLPEAGDTALKEAQKVLKGLLGTGWDKDEDGTVDVAGINVAKDVRIVSLNGNNGVAVEIDLKWEQEVAAIPFDLGLDGFPLRIDNGMLKVKLGVEYDSLRVTLPDCGNPAGAHLDFSQNSTFSFTVNASLEGTTVSGTIGFLAMTATDAGTKFQAGFDFGVSDPGGQGLPSITGVTLTTDVSDVWLQLEAGFADGDSITPDGPSISAKLHVQWDFANEDSLDQVDTEFGEAPLVEFRDVTLKLGEFITDTVGPVLDKIQKATEPIMPLVNVLTEPIPVVSDLFGEVTLLDVLAYAGGEAASEYEPLIDLAATVVEVVNMIHDIENVDKNATITIVDQVVIQDPNNKIREKHPNYGDILKKDWSDLVTEYQDNTAAINTVKEGIKKACPNDQPDDGVTSLCESLVAKIEQYQAGIQKSIDLQFPFFEDPIKNVMNLFLGHDADLVSFTAQFSAAASQSLPPIPLGPIEIEMGNDVYVDAKLRLAYDTFGLRQAIETGELERLAEGLYLDTTSKLAIGGGLWAKASVGYVFVEGVVEGGLRADFVLSLDQSNNNPGVDNDPAKLRPFADELGDCVFETGGSVYAFLDVGLQVGIDPFSIEFTMNLAKETLLDLGHTCTNPFEPPAVLLASTHADDASIPEGELWLNLGARSVTRNYKGDPTKTDPTMYPPSELYEPNETYEIRPDENDPSCVVVTAFGLTQQDDAGNTRKFCGITKIWGDAGEGNDLINIKEGVTAAVELVGGKGEDSLVYQGTGPVTMHGGAGNDILVAGGGNAKLWGDEGDDQLQGGWGMNELHGGLDNDRIRGGDAWFSSNKIYGDAGDDELVAGPNGDLLDGGAGDDVILAGPGGDDIYGGPDDDSITWLVEYDVPQLISGGAGKNTLGIFGTTAPDTFTLSQVAGQLKIAAPAGKMLFPQQITELNVDGLGGADTFTVHSLTGTRVENVGINLSDNLMPDGAEDIIKVYGSSDNGTYGVQGESAIIQKLPCAPPVEPDDCVNNVFGGVMKMTMQNTPSTELVYTVRAMNLADDLTLDTLAGNDTISVRSVTGPTEILAGPGDDRFVVKADKTPPNSALPFPYMAPLELDAGTGAKNRIEFEFESSFVDLQVEQITLTDTSLVSDRLVRLPVQFKATGGSFGDDAMLGAGVKLTTASDADVVDVKRTLANVTTSINTAGGDDTVNVSSDGATLQGNLAAIRSKLSVDVGAGAANQLNLSDFAGTAGNLNVTISASQISGLAGPSDTSIVEYKATAGTVQVTIKGSNSASLVETFTISGPSSPVAIQANAGNDVIHVKANTKPVDIQAGPGNDTVKITEAAKKLDAILGPVTISGQEGTDLVSVFDSSAVSGQTYKLASNTLSRTGTGNISFDSTVEKSIVATSNFNDTINVTANPAVTLVAFLAGLGSDKITGPNTANQWAIQTSNNGTLNAKITFASVENITGGSQDDKFLFAAGQGIAGKLDGGTGGNDALDLSAYTTAVIVNLWTKQATGVAGGWTNLDAFIGGAGSDTLIGTNALLETILANFWQVTGMNRGVTSSMSLGSISFDKMDNLRGGFGIDHFAFGSLGSVTGKIDGVAGKDLLDYSNVAQAVTVNLASGTVSKVGGTVANIEDVTGGSGDDLLRGNAAANILKGGAGNDILAGGDAVDGLFGEAGRDLLIGGTAADLLFGGADDDILVGGSTAHDSNDQALRDILTEWTKSTLSYNQRVQKIRTGVGATGTVKLNATTWMDDLITDKLTGDAGDDWFWAKLTGLASEKDQIILGPVSPEVVN